MPTDVQAPPHHLAFTVYGTPAPQGSKTWMPNHAMIESNQRELAAWRQDVKYAAMAAMTIEPGWLRDYPLIFLHVVFTLPRPASHFGTGRNALILKATAPTMVGTRPDLDKLLRSTGDALAAAGALPNDARITSIYAAKCYTRAGDGGPIGALEVPGAQVALTGVAR